MPTTALKKMKLSDIHLSQANRDIVRPHVERLKELIRKYGYINSLPIIVDEDGMIIDGQHRFIACQELKIEPPIVVDASFDIVPILNSTQLRWTIVDYVKYYAAKGYEHYVVLEQLCKAKDLKPGIIYNIIFGKSVDKTGLARSAAKFPLKDGSFKFPDLSKKGLDKIERKIDKVMHLVHLLNLPKTDRLIIAIARLATDPHFVFDTMEAKIEYQKARIYRCSTIQEYMQMLANIYNNKNTKKVAV